MSLNTLGRQVRWASRGPLSIRQKLMWGYGINGDFTPEAMGADWEYADGTPAPRTASQAFVERNLRVYVESIIDACATVEAMAEQNQLPSKPGTDLIRKYDPMVPLYLPIDDMVLDGSSSTSQKYEVYGEAAPYYYEGTPDISQGVNRHTAGDGTPLEGSVEDPESVRHSKSKKGRRRKVSIVKQHWRTTQPVAGPKSGPFNKQDASRFDVGHGTGA
eukprot:TRINITY_DN458_c1_g1_i4.p1 TRINITY_DN458_c1_g1~~TRINITY_DN458_c1_g1_i4.p1  ORF type:complete len:217 (+),score=33.98 TRINITY_DN458_c1_g1_i4:70-720(+)